MNQTEETFGNWSILWLVFMKLIRLYVGYSKLAWQQVSCDY
jgi:hypothetical protein